MADPLSIAASIVGLIAATGKVYNAVSSLIATTAGAPSSAASTLEIVSDMRLTLAAVQSVIDSLDGVPSSRKGLIQIDHLTIVITHAVVTISELEELVCKETDLAYRLRWAWNEKKVLELLPRLESQKSTLALMVSVLQW